MVRYIVMDKYLVFIILRNAPTELRRVKIWALPVPASVTVITGQENTRKASNDSKRWPQDLSYLHKRYMSVFNRIVDQIYEAKNKHQGIL